MEGNKKYKVIVSDRAKRMLGKHIRFMAQANKQAAAEKRNYGSNAFSFTDDAALSIF